MITPCLSLIGLEECASRLSGGQLWVTGGCQLRLAVLGPCCVPSAVPAPERCLCSCHACQWRVLGTSGAPLGVRP